MKSKIRYGITKFVIASQIRHDITNFVMTSKSASWSHEVRHDVKNTSWRQIVHYICRHNNQNTSWRQKYVMTSKLHHQVNYTSWDQKVRHDVTNTSWHQKYRHDVKNTSRSQRVCHDVEQIVMTSKSFLVMSRIHHDVKKFVMISKSAFWLHKTSQKYIVPSKINQYVNIFRHDVKQCTIQTQQQKIRNDAKKYVI